MRDELSTTWDERFIKRLKRAARDGEIAGMLSRLIGFAVVIYFWMVSADLIWRSLRPPAD